MNFRLTDQLGAELRTAVPTRHEHLVSRRWQLVEHCHFIDQCCSRILGMQDPVVRATDFAMRDTWRTEVVAACCREVRCAVLDLASCYAVGAAELGVLE